MARDARPPKLLLALLCAVVLAVRIGDMHLHLCHDGQEAPGSIHVLDLGIHHEQVPADAAPHQDVDVAFAADLIAKAGKSSASPPLLALTIFLFGLLLPVLRTARPQLTVPPLQRRRFFAHPPQRGPPAFSSC